MKHLLLSTKDIRMQTSRTYHMSRLSIWFKNFFFLTLTLAFAPVFTQEAKAQTTPSSETPVEEAQYAPPVWWFGLAAAGNVNMYWGTTQQLNDGFATPAAFHKGLGAGLYLAPVLEYRPNPMWGGILQIGYDDRRAAFYDVTCPCGENSTLNAKPSYISIEPSVRLAPFSGDFYLFAGPRVAFAWSAFGADKEFVYTQEGAGTTTQDFDNWRSVVFSGQFGLGYDVHLNSNTAKTQWHLAPFASYQPHFGQDPRTSENWAVSTLRVGAALKFGRGKRYSAGDPEVRFSVRVPKNGGSKSRVKETFPLRNYVFFDDSSSKIPSRYETLTKREATDFREEQLQEAEPKSLKGRSNRQMSVYYNILNTLGDRMKRNPKTQITLTGSSVKGPAHAKARADEVKMYLVNTFGIEESRISTEGRENQRALDQSGGTADMQALQAGNQRVEITSRSPEMLLQVGSPQDDLKPVSMVGPVEQQDSVIFNVAGGKNAFAFWNLEVTDEKGGVQHFGQFTGNRAAIPQKTILGKREQGDYSVAMIGEATDGSIVRKETTIHLVRAKQEIQDVTRFTILFDFGETKTVASYEKFLTEVVVPLISDSNVVIIRGQTDVVGEPAYNENLSRERAQGTQTILEQAVLKNGKKGVTYETVWYGEDADHAAFDNDLPEQRAYNRTVIIDIVPN